MQRDLTSAVDYSDRGVTYAKQGRYDRAISDFNKALELDPTYAWAYHNRGLAYADGKKDFDRAIADYNKALEINPRYFDAYFGRGYAYRVKGDYDKAISDYSEALDINPRFAEAYYNRAVAYYLNKEYDKAWDDLHKAEAMGREIHPRFLRGLREASGREK
jgi:tetratricopeptide (TPR) repeat protein